MRVIYLVGSNTFVTECSKIKQISPVELFIDSTCLTLHFPISAEVLLSDIVDLRPYQSRNGYIDTFESNNLFEVLRVQDKVIMPTISNCLDTPPWVMFLYTLPSSYSTKFRYRFGELPMAWISGVIESQDGDLSIEQVKQLIAFVNDIGYTLE